ncbi:protein-tyrosine phosphatase-like protein, partial [Chytridium lagenaria]
MIWEQDTRVIVMLCEADSRGRKCHTYYPTIPLGSTTTTTPSQPTPTPSHTLKYGRITVTLLSSRRVRSLIHLRTFRITLSHSSLPPRIVAHVQYVGWPDAGVPESRTRWSRSIISLTVSLKRFNRLRNLLLFIAVLGVDVRGRLLLWMRFCRCCILWIRRLW